MKKTTFNTIKNITKFDFPCISQFDLDLIYETNDIEFLCKVLEKLNEIIDSQNLIVEDFNKIVQFVNEKIEEYTKNQLNEWLEDGTIENMFLKLGNVAKTFNTVIDMQKDTKLKVNMIVNTLGYYDIDENSNGLWLITNKKNDEYIQVKINNDLYANYIIENSIINVKSIGAHGDFIHDDIEIIQKAINNSNRNIVFFPQGRYLISKTIIIPFSGVHLKGTNTRTFDGSIDNGSTIWGDVTTNLIMTNNSKHIGRVIIEFLVFQTKLPLLTTIFNFENLDESIFNCLTVLNGCVKIFDLKNSGINNIYDSNLYDASNSVFSISNNGSLMISNCNIYKNEYVFNITGNNTFSTQISNTWIENSKLVKSEYTSNISFNNCNISDNTSNFEILNIENSENNPFMRLLFNNCFIYSNNSNNTIINIDEKTKQVQEIRFNNSFYSGSYKLTNLIANRLIIYSILSNIDFTKDNIKQYVIINHEYNNLCIKSDVPFKFSNMSPKTLNENNQLFFGNDNKLKIILNGEVKTIQTD